MKSLPWSEVLNLFVHLKFLSFSAKMVLSVTNHVMGHPCLKDQTYSSRTLQNIKEIKSMHLTGQNVSFEQMEIIPMTIAIIVSPCLINEIYPDSTQKVVSVELILFISDPKTADWPLVATPWPTVAFLAAYLSIVKVGPKIMEKRRAYNLREVLIVYNFAIVLLSAYMMYEVSAEVRSCVFSWSVFAIFDIHFSFPF